MDPAKIVEAIRSIAISFGPIGLVLSIAGVFTYGGLYLGIVPPTALGGHVAENTTLIIVLGIGFLSGAAIVHAISFIKFLYSNIKTHFNKPKIYKKLRENLEFAPPGSQLLLLIAINMPSGRMATLGRIPSFMRLFELGLMVGDDGDHGIYNVSFSMTRVNPIIYERKSEIISQLNSNIRNKLNIDPSNSREIENRAADLIKRERGETWMAQ